MSTNQKEYKVSRLTHGLADTESLQVLHSEKTLAYNTVLAYYFMQRSSQEVQIATYLIRKNPPPLPLHFEALLPFQFG